MRIVTRIRVAVALATFGGTILYGVVLSLLGMDAEKVKERVARIMAGPILKMARIRLVVTGREKLKGIGPAVYVGNQQSVLCYCIYANLFREIPRSGIVARLTEEWNIPLVTYLFRKTGNFMVDPKNPLRTGVGFVQARRSLEEEGGSVWMGPEGTRWKEPGVLGPFKPGAFRLAIETQLPIVPLVISPLKPRTDLSVPRVDPQEVELRILDPIPTEGRTLEELQPLREEVRGLMQEALMEMGREPRSSLE